jgi:hypothetical protein
MMNPMHSGRPQRMPLRALPRNNRTVGRMHSYRFGSKSIIIAVAVIAGIIIALFLLG